MKREAYRTYFPDTDLSYKYADLFFQAELLDKKENISDSIENPINLTIKEGEIIKSFCFDMEKNKWEHRIDACYTLEQIVDYLIVEANYVASSHFTIGETYAAQKALDDIKTVKEETKEKELEKKQSILTNALKQVNGIPIPKRCKTPKNVTLSYKYIMYYEKYDISVLKYDVLSDFTSSVYPVRKGAARSNGNKGNMFKQGMFNVSKNSSVSTSGEIGNRNNIHMSGGYAFDGYQAYESSCSLIAKDDNFVDINMKTCFDSSSIICGSNNYLRSYGKPFPEDIDLTIIPNGGSVTNADGITVHCEYVGDFPVYSSPQLDGIFNETCIFNENNIVINPDLSFKTGLYLLPQYPKLAFRTTITETGKEGDKFVTVKDASFVLAREKFMFSSEHAAFVIREVSKVEGNKIYFEKVVTQDEIPIKHGLCFSEAPVELDEIDTEIKMSAKKFTRRLYVDDLKNENVHLRKMNILNGNKVLFNTVALYYDEPSRLLIMNKTLPFDIYKADGDYRVVFPAFKFAKPVNFTAGEDIPNVYIGQKVTCENNTYTVNGFDTIAKTISLEEIDFSKLKGKYVETAEVPDEYYKLEKIPFTKLKVLEGKRYLDIIKVEPTKGLIKEAFVRYEATILKIKDIVNKNHDGNEYTEIILEAPFLPIIMNNMIVEGSFATQMSFNVDPSEDIKELLKIKKDYYENNNSTN